jgi:hypothetical protein
MLRDSGVELIDHYLSEDDCGQLLRDIEEYRSAHEIPTIYRAQPGRSLRYLVIDGDRIHESFPGIVGIYRRVGQLVQRMGGMDLAPLSNRAASVNVNVIEAGGEYRWHYDRNAVTAILYLNAVSGGETEMYPNYRLRLGRWKHTCAQRWLDRVLRTRWLIEWFGHKTEISPRAGRILVMRGDRCLHSVRPVEGPRERVNIIMTFDLPDARFPVQRDLDPYLYSKVPAPSVDPNYRR